jgi:DNA processing protein
MNEEISEIGKEKFPKLLLETNDPPEKLFVRGLLPKEETKLLAVVGSRRYTEYGKSVCEKLLSELSPYNIAIVSGLALGIDSIAHRVALENNIKTIAVPGSGLDEKVIYPSSHKLLANKIVENGGALISPFAPKTKALPYMFPKRNTVIAGISHGVLVIEAEERSGTLITARLGMEYNREVMTVPTSIYSANGQGPNELIKVGATPVTKVDDILESLCIEKREVVESATNLSGAEKTLYKILKEPLSKTELVEKVSSPIEEINMTLSAMEIKGLIKESLGKIHRAQ